VQITKELNFIDSFKFMSLSLIQQYWQKNLDKEQFANLKKHYPDTRFDLLTQKGAYPYDYVYSVKS